MSVPNVTLEPTELGNTGRLGLDLANSINRDSSCRLDVNQKLIKNPEKDWGQDSQPACEQGSRSGVGVQIVSGLKAAPSADF